MTNMHYHPLIEVSDSNTSKAITKMAKMALATSPYPNKSNGPMNTILTFQEDSFESFESAAAFYLQAV